MLLRRKNPNALDAPMAHAELVAARSALDMTPAQFADLLDVTLYELEEFESGRRKIPKKLAILARASVADRQGAAIMVASGPPACEVAERLAERSRTALNAMTSELARSGDVFEDVDAEVDAANAAFIAHAEGCELCRARKEYAEVHVPPTPELPGERIFAALEPIARAGSFLLRLARVPEGVTGSGRRTGLGMAAALGALVLVFPFSIMFVLAIARGSFVELAGIAGFWLVVSFSYLVGGLLAGWVFDLTRRIRHTVVGYVVRGALCLPAIYGVIGLLISIIEGDPLSSVPGFMLFTSGFGALFGAGWWVFDRIRGKLPRPVAR